MKMLYKYMSAPVDFENSCIKLLVIEDKRLFRKTILSVLSLFAQNEKSFRIK